MSESKMDRLIAVLERQGKRLDRMADRLEKDGRELREMRLELREIRLEAEYDEPAIDSLEQRATA